ncbi:unnamed protein product [Pleuronectes platessa]|uniref:Uncharacterized protein n=1 Tax=Pleuronectes platessa TaxID=8262 RepID=A0A9N7TWW4_PLEPL|nr:unnamed protein product [Pleuronectes platessa]
MPPLAGSILRVPCPSTAPLAAQPQGFPDETEVRGALWSGCERQPTAMSLRRPSAKDKRKGSMDLQTVTVSSSVLHKWHTGDEKYRTWSGDLSVAVLRNWTSISPLHTAILTCCSIWEFSNRIYTRMRRGTGGARSVRVTSVCPGECGAYVSTGVVCTELLCNSVSHAVSPAGVPWQGAASFPSSAFIATDV